MRFEHSVQVGYNYSEKSYEESQNLSKSIYAITSWMVSKIIVDSMYIYEEEDTLETHRRLTTVLYRVDRAILFQ